MAGVRIFPKVTQQWNQYHVYDGRPSVAPPPSDPSTQSPTPIKGAATMTSAAAPWSQLPPTGPSYAHA